MRFLKLVSVAGWFGPSTRFFFFRHSRCRRSASLCSPRAWRRKAAKLLRLSRACRDDRGPAHARNLPETPKRGLCLDQLTLVLKGNGKVVVEAGERVSVVGAHHALPPLQRLPVHRIRLAQLAPLMKECGGALKSVSS